MAKLNIFLLVLLFFYCQLHKANSQPTDFIEAECRATRYPALCIKYLSNYSTTIQQNHRQLAQAALSVSLSQAQSAASFVSKLSRMRGMKAIEYRAVKDCIENMRDTVDQLSRSMKELGGMGQLAGRDFDWSVSNIQSWVSAALTDENTCLDGFGRPAMDGNVKVAIRRRIVGCAQVSSITLALVNHFATRHKV